MLVTRGLGRDGTAKGAVLVSFGLGRQAYEELGGKPIRRWRSRIRRDVLEDLPIIDQKTFLRRVERALEALKKDKDPTVAKRAERVRKGLVEADSVKRRSLLRLNFEVVLDQLEVVSWALDAYEGQRNRRRLDDEDFLVLMLAARERYWI